MQYPTELYSIKVEYIEDGERRVLRSGYHDQGSFLHIFSRFETDYSGCLIESVSLVKVVFASGTEHGPEIEVGKIPVPVGYNWLGGIQ